MKPKRKAIRKRLVPKRATWQDVVNKHGGKAERALRFALNFHGYISTFDANISDQSIVIKDAFAFDCIPRTSITMSQITSLLTDATKLYDVDSFVLYDCIRHFCRVSSLFELDPRELPTVTRYAMNIPKRDIERHAEKRQAKEDRFFESMAKQAS